jgi:hypothetical protein
MTHHCHARSCQTYCKPECLMCLKHWRMVPKDIQRWVWDEYRPGQCDDKSPSEAWHAAADAAIKAVWDKEQKTMARPIIQHSKESTRHFTPAPLPDMLREVFGGPIHTDPFSESQANLLIGAEQYFTESDNGWAQPWLGNTWVNAPGGRIIYQGVNVNQAALAYATLATRFGQGQVSQAGFMVFNLELFRYAQGFNVPQPLDFLVCFPMDRIDFWKPGTDYKPIPQGSPAHPNAVIYMGPNRERFRDVFGPARPGWSGGFVWDPNTKLSRPAQGPRLVILESPYAGDIDRNVQYARACLKHSLDLGESPLVSHLQNTQVLDDNIPEQRERGIEAGLAWGRVADMTAIYCDMGVSSGMRRGFDRALAEGRKVDFRYLGGEWSDRK